MKKIVLKVSMHCRKCKTQVLKAVAKLEGIDQVSVDIKKGTLTVIGDVDPVLVVKRVRKAGKVAEIVSVGPPKPPKEELGNLVCRSALPSHWNACQHVAVSHAPYDDRFCSIL